MVAFALSSLDASPKIHKLSARDPGQIINPFCGHGTHLRPTRPRPVHLPRVVRAPDICEHDSCGLYPRGNAF